MSLTRYIFLIGLAVTALGAVLGASAETGQRFLVDAGQGTNSRDVFFWMLGGIALVTSASLCRFVLFGIPSMFGSWYQSNRQWLYAILFGGVIWGALYLI